MSPVCDPPDPIAAAPGRIVGGRYRPDAMIGRGGNALVYCAVDLRNGDRVALKLLRPEVSGDADRRRELLDEGARMAGLLHPRIARLRDAGMAESGPFLAMELLAGPDLRDPMRSGWTLPAAETASLLAGIGDALFYMHGRELAHADVKPGNLVRTRDGALKLIDFGTAQHLRASGHADRPSARPRIVTPAYAAPELMRGEAADRRDDVFSLAVVAYELMAGRHPFLRRTVQPGEVPPPAPGLGRTGWTWLRAALSFARADRPADPRGLAASIRADRPLARVFGRRIACRG